MPSPQVELRKKGIEVIGSFVLKIKTGFRNLEMVTLQDVEERGLREVGDLTFATASYSDYFGAMAHIPEEEIPAEAVAYRIGKPKKRSDSEVFVPISFYKR